MLLLVLTLLPPTGSAIRTKLQDKLDNHDISGAAVRVKLNNLFSGWSF